MTKTKTTTATCIIACEVFRAAFNYLKLEDRYPSLCITYLPARLHLKPLKLKEHLLREIKKARKRCNRIICVYGDCFPDMGNFCKQHRIMKVRGFTCYEMFLGNARFNKLLDEVTGTYFVEEGMITDFEDSCVRPLELHDEEIRRQCFAHYERLLYIRQPSDPDLLSKANELAQFLGLSLEVDDVDYSCLEKELNKLL